ncbi:MAG: hypothetical protein U0841_04315 [Chloroflexia bacterium]
MAQERVHSALTATPDVGTVGIYLDRRGPGRHHGRMRQSGLRA